MPKQNPLEQYFRANDQRLIHKWIHQFDIYHRHFERFRKRPITVVEFGVSHGGSLQMWRTYFGRKAHIYGIDIDPECKNLGGKRITIFIGDQEDREFLRTIAAQIGPIDILIEDGGHHMGQQIATFEEFYPQVKSDGVLLIDDLNAHHSKDDDLVVSDFTTSTRAIHVYDSVIVFEKGEIENPHAEKTGTPTLGQ